MESDSTLPALSLIISFSSFFFAAVGEASLASVRPESVQGLVARGARGSTELQYLNSITATVAGAFLLLKCLLLGASILSAAALSLALWESNWWLVALAGVAILTLSGVAQVAARAMAAVFGEWIALNTAFAARGLTIVFSPVLAVDRALVQRVRGAMSNESDPPGEVDAPEMNISVNTSGEPLDEHEMEMIKGVVQLDTTTAREIMVPRVDMVVAERDSSLEQLAEQMMESGHSRIPIFEGDLDHIQGIAHARDIVGILSTHDNEQTTLTDDAIRPALFIPETKTLEELLHEFQEQQVHIAIVVDEYGGVAGLVTIEDLLEEIVGEIRDEFDVGEPEVMQVGANEILMDARVTLDDLNELLRVTVHGNGFDTVGGFVYHRLGKIPSPGDSVEESGLTIKVVSTVGRRLKKLLVTKRVNDLDTV